MHRRKVPFEPRPIADADTGAALIETGSTTPKSRIREMDQTSASPYEMSMTITPSGVTIVTLTQHCGV